MKPVRTETCNITGVADDAADLPACKHEGVVYTYWKPDASEVVDIMAGKPVRVMIKSSIIPYMAVDTKL